MRGNPFLNQAVEEHPACLGCNKPCFPSERPLMALGGSWHPGCLKCTTCGITLSPRMMESYNKKPYCRAHRPDPRATQVSDDFHKVQATAVVPKAPRRQPGVDVTQRQTFYAGPGQLDQLQKQLHEQKTQINPTGYVPDKPAAPNRLRAQGVNKLEGTTFNEASITNQRGAAPAHSEPQSWDGGSVEQNYGGHDQSGGGYDQGGHDQGGYDQGGYDQGGYDQGGHDASGGYDQGGYDQGGYDQGGHDQGGYDQGGHDQGGYDQGGYDQGGHDQGGYDQGGYDQGSYDQGSYDQGSYDQGGYDQGSYDQGAYDENNQYNY